MDENAGSLDKTDRPLTLLSSPSAGAPRVIGTGRLGPGEACRPVGAGGADQRPWMGNGISGYIILETAVDRFVEDLSH